LLDELFETEFDIES